MRHALSVWIALGLLACGGSETGKQTSGSGGANGSGGTSHILDASTSGSGGGGPCAPGAETCPCYGNGTCNATLTCASNLCVRLGTGGGTGSGGGGGTAALDGGAAAATGAGGLAATAWYCANANSDCVCVPNDPGTSSYDGCSTPKPTCCVLATSPVAACICEDLQGADCAAFVAANGAAVEACPPNGPTVAPEGGLCIGPGDGYCDANDLCCPGLVCITQPEGLGGVNSTVCAVPCGTGNDCESGCCTAFAPGRPKVCAPSQDCVATCEKAGSDCTNDPGSCCDGSACVFDDNSETTAHCLKSCTADSQCSSNCCAPLEFGSAVCEDASYCPD